MCVRVQVAVFKIKNERIRRATTLHCLYCATSLKFVFASAFMLHALIEQFKQIENGKVVYILLVPNFDNTRHTQVVSTSCRPALLVYNIRNAGTPICHSWMHCSAHKQALLRLLIRPAANCANSGIAHVR